MAHGAKRKKKNGVENFVGNMNRAMKFGNLLLVNEIRWVQWKIRVSSNNVRLKCEITIRPIAIANTQIWFQQNNFHNLYFQISVRTTVTRCCDETVARDRKIYSAENYLLMSWTQTQTYPALAKHTQIYAAHQAQPHTRAHRSMCFTLHIVLLHAVFHRYERLILSKFNYDIFQTYEMSDINYRQLFRNFRARATKFLYPFSFR